jgi:uncharacterized membrane protein
LFVANLAVARHDNLSTNAFDLGYISQTLWSTAHGQPYRMATIEGATFEPEGLDPSRMRRPHSYLAFHVEPLLLLLAPLYGLWPSPRLLLWLQAAVIALGSMPAAWLARRLLGSSLAGVFIGAAWLLAPGLQGAALSDFHLVALAATWLMFALWALAAGRRRLALLFLVLTAASREDAALVVAWLVVLLLIASRLGGARPALLTDRSGPMSASEYRPAYRDGLALAVLALGAGAWSTICFARIMPYFNGGGSLFWSRYSWLGPHPRAAVERLVADPRLLLDWLGHPDVASYLLLQVLTGGLLCVLAPLQLMAAAPILAMNALSGFDWMRSGGAHYSAIVVPLLLWSGLLGAARLRRRAWLVLPAGALAAHLWIGASPLRPGFTWPALDPRATTVRAALAAVPPDAAVSATSGLHSHLADRVEAHWFPAGEDAPWLALDTLGTPHPLTPAELHFTASNLLRAGGYRLAAAADGLLLLLREAGAPPVDPDALPQAYYGSVRFADAGVAAPSFTFGDELALIEASLRRRPQVGLFGDAGVLELVWRPLRPVSRDHQFVLVTTRARDGAIVGFQFDVAAAARWHPTSRWRTDEVVRLEMPVDRLGGVGALGIAVVDPAGRRLPVAAADGGLVWEGSIAAVPLEKSPAWPSGLLPPGD